MTKVESIKKLLQSAHKEQIIEGLKEFEHNRFTELIPELLHLYERNDNEINTIIIFLLTNMKQKNGADVLIQSFKTLPWIEKHPELIRICWENGLNYSSHLDFFAELFTRSSYETALEAFTVIEENLEHAQKHDLEACVKILKSAETNISTMLKSLYSELIKLLEQKINSF